MIIYSENIVDLSEEDLEFAALLQGTIHNNPNYCSFKEDEDGTIYYDIEDEVFQYLLSSATDDYITKLIKDGFEVMKDKLS